MHINSSIGILPYFRRLNRSLPLLPVLWALLTTPIVLAESNGWIPTPERPPIAQLREAALPPVEITALRFQHRGEYLEKPPLRVYEGESLSFEAEIHCRTAQWSHAPEFIVQVAGEGPTLRESYTLPVDVCNAVGGVGRHTGEFYVPRYALNGVAKLSLFVAQSAHDEAAPIENLLYVAPLYIQPAVLETTLAPEAAQAVFGEDSWPLGKRFRLGKQASVRLSLPTELPFAPRRLGIISRIEYTATHQQGEPVCSVRVEYAETEAQSVLLRNGVHTGFGNRNYYVPDATSTRSPPVFGRWEADGMNEAGEPYNLQLYWSVVNLPEGPTPNALELQYVKPEGLLEVRDVVLLP